MVVRSRIARALPGLGVAALMALAPQGASAADPRVCSVEAVEGPEARGWSAGEWSPLRAGQAVAFEAKVSTGPRTRVKISCEDGIVVTVGTGSEVNLGTLAASDRSVVLQLIEGIVGLVAPGGFAAFDVRTPLAIASVRSTEWLVEHDSADGSAVFVRDGEVAVRVRAGGWFTLGSGEGISIALDGTPGAVKTWGAARISRSTSALGFDWQ